MLVTASEQVYVPRQATASKSKVPYSNVVIASAISIIENEKFFELKSKGYRNGIKRKETR